MHSFAICGSEPQPNYVGGALPNSTDSVRSAQQECGAGNGKVIGGGASIATSESFLSQSYPYDGGDANSTPDDGWAVRAYDTVGGMGGMSLQAVCQSGSVSYVTATDRAGAGHSASVTADCPAGTHASGAGGKITGPGGQVHLAGSYPADDGDADTTPDDGWKASAFNDSSKQQTSTAYAACLD